MDSISSCAPAPDIPVDIKDLLKRCLGRTDIVERILRKFHGTLQSDLLELETAVRASDTAAIAHIAHRLKGASLSVAAHGLKEHAQKIEISAVNRRLEEIHRCFAQLKEACAQFDNLGSIVAMAKESSGGSRPNQET